VVGKIEVFVPDICFAVSGAILQAEAPPMAA
jgi:hypothetical protein